MAVNNVFINLRLQIYYRKRKSQAQNVTCFIMYVTFLLEKRVFVLCNMENGGRKREEKPKALSKQR